MKNINFLKTFVLCALLFASLLMHIGSAYAEIGDHPRLFLTPERMAQIEDKRANDPDGIYSFFTGRLNHYLGGDPYAREELAAAFALAYKLTGNTAYRDEAIQYIYTDRDYFNPDNTWYQGGNQFRWYGPFTIIFFDWIYDDLSQEQKDQALAAFRRWGDYHLTRMDYNPNPDAGADVVPGNWVLDSDHISSVAENFLLLGVMLTNEAGYEATAEYYLEAADNFRKIIEKYYFEDVMAGGVWAEGTFYSPNTMRHWIKVNIINHELRELPDLSNPNAYDPSAYMEKNLISLLHRTFPDYSSMYIYNDIESFSSDYVAVAGRGRYDYALMLTDITANADIKSLGQYWLNSAKSTSDLSSHTITGLWRLLFERPNDPAQSPEQLSMPTHFYAEGIQFIAMRENWSDTSNQIFFHNSRWALDHMKRSALSFNIFRNGKVITKDCSGYSGISAETYAHNSILIENRDNWSNSPEYDSQGQGTYPVMSFNNGFNYIEAEAADVYNFSKWQGLHTYVDHARRKFLWIKPGYVIVYDYVKLVDDDVLTYGTVNSSQPDTQANLYEGHKRRVRYVQHFQVEPQLSNGVYAAHSEGQRFFVKTLLPDNADTTVVDELNGGDPRFDAPGYQMPDHQKKWHIEVGPATAPDDNITRMLHALYFDADTATSMPPTSEITVAAANMVGAHVADSTRNFVALFASGAPGTDIEQVQYTLTTTAPSRHVLADMQSNMVYTVQINGVSSSIASDNDGILTFDDSSSGERTYAISGTPDIDNDTDGYTENQGDCNDSPDSNGFDIHPGADEVCGDGVDNDCDGQTDCSDDACSSLPSCQSDSDDSGDDTDSDDTGDDTGTDDSSDGPGTDDTGDNTDTSGSGDSGGSGGSEGSSGCFIDSLLVLP